MIKSSIACCLLVIFSTSLCHAFEFNFNSDKIIDDLKNNASDITSYTQEKFKNIKKGVSEYFSDDNSNSEISDKNFQNVWKRFFEVSNDAIELAVKNNPNEKTTFEFVTLQEPKYVRLIKEAQEILGTSEASQQFSLIEKLRDQNKEYKGKITELKRKRITAPEKSINPMTATKKNIDNDIANLSNEIKSNENEISKLKSEIITIINKNGVNLSMDELNYFIVSAEGNDLVGLIIIVENMKRIQKIIENELKNDNNNVELVRVYTGMYLVSLDAYANAHDKVIDNIYKYRSKLDDIKQEANTNYDEAKKLRNTASESDMSNINSNIKINERTLEVANMYDNLLSRRTDNLRESKSNLEKKVQIARNTYKTVVNGSSLINLVNNGSNEYMLLINFEMPELKNMYDDTIMSAFSDISDRIKMEK